MRIREDLGTVVYAHLPDGGYVVLHPGDAVPDGAVVDDALTEATPRRSSRGKPRKSQ